MITAQGMRIKAGDVRNAKYKAFLEGRFEGDFQRLLSRIERAANEGKNFIRIQPGQLTERMVKELEELGFCIGDAKEFAPYSGDWQREIVFISWR